MAHGSYGNTQHPKQEAAGLSSGHLSAFLGFGSAGVGSPQNERLPKWLCQSLILRESMPCLTGTFICIYK